MESSADLPLNLETARTESKLVQQKAKIIEKALRSDKYLNDQAVQDFLSKADGTAFMDLGSQIIDITKSKFPELYKAFITSEEYFADLIKVLSADSDLPYESVVQNTQTLVDTIVYATIESGTDSKLTFSTSRDFQKTAEVIIKEIERDKALGVPDIIAPLVGCCLAQLESIRLTNNLPLNSTINLGQALEKQNKYHINKSQHQNSS